MNKGKTIFAQIMSLINEYEFKKCVDRYRGDRHAIKFNCPFSEQLFKEHNYDLLWDAQAQLFLADKLWEVLPENRKQEMYIYNGTSSGRPWTEISISDGNTIIPGYDESLFWRIDIRNGQFYIRLNQYSWYEDDEQRTIYLKKQERLRQLRSISDELLEKGGYSLKKGKPTEVGSYEQEIVIFFLPENDWSTIFKEIPKFTEMFLDRYKDTFNSSEVDLC